MQISDMLCQTVVNNREELMLLIILEINKNYSAAMEARCSQGAPWPTQLPLPKNTKVRSLVPLNARVCTKPWLSTSRVPMKLTITAKTPYKMNKHLTETLNNVEKEVTSCHALVKPTSSAMESITEQSSTTFMQMQCLDVLHK
jgi:hypothetical protein